MMVLNPFELNDPFLYPLKMGDIGGIEMEYWD